MALRARDVLELTVPHYAAFALGSPVAAYLVVTGAPPPPRFVLVVLSLLLAYLGFNVLNMLGDAALDAEAKPTRALPSGRTSRGEAAALAIALLGGGAAVGALLDARLALLVALVAALALAYSVRPLRLRARWWGTTCVAALSHGVVPFVAAEVAAGRPLRQPLALALFALPVAAVANLKDLEDVVAERRMGMTSLVARLGERATFAAVLAALTLALVGAAALSTVHALPAWWSRAAAAGALLLVPTALALALLVEGLRRRNLRSAGRAGPVREHERFQSAAATVGSLYAVALQLLFGLFALGATR